MVTPAIRTPDQRLRVFISSTLQELASEREAVRDAVKQLRLTPVMFEAGARPHPPRELYRSYLAQSDIFIGIYWERYGWVAPGEQVSGLEDEYVLSGPMPKLIYVKEAVRRDARLRELLDRIRADDRVSYKHFSSPEELSNAVQDDLALVLTERFDAGEPRRDAEVPMARAADRLPVPPTSFIGRESERAEVADLLGRSDVRLLTIMGPGGIGKTRFAFHLLEELGSGFKDGSAFVLLAGLGDSGMVIPALGQALGVTESGERSLMDNLKVALRDKEMLLLLDNFEHVVASGDLISELIADCPGIKILVTSRAALNLRGEHEYHMPPMTVPAGDRATSGGESLSDAVRLFVERARAANPDFSLTVENREAVVQICERLDGLPLAIELAAARARLLSPEAMLPRLWRRLGLLKGGHRDLPERQRTLRATIDWDYELLTEEERVVFRRVAIYAGSFTLAEAAQAIDAFEITGIDTLEIVDSLVRKSLLAHVPDAIDEPRFSMLRTLREYAFERLDEHGETEGLKDRHAEGFLALVENAEPHLGGPDQVRWLDVLEKELDNIRAALRWLSQRGDVDKEIRFVGALARFWELRSYLSEGQQWLENALAKAPETQPELRAKCLEGAGVLALGQVELKRAAALMTECVALRREIGDQSALATSIKNLGNVFYVRGDLDAARSLFEESMDLKKQVGDGGGVADALNNLGVIASLEKDWDRAASLYAEALSLFHDHGDALGVGRALMNLGEIRNEQGDYEEAERLIKESIVVHRRLGSRWDYCDLLEELGRIYAAKGDPNSAAVLFGAGDSLRGLLGTPLPLGERERYDSYLEATRDRLGEDGFEAAWEKGRRMDADEALDLALSL